LVGAAKAYESDDGAAAAPSEDSDGLLPWHRSEFGRPPTPTDEEQEASGAIVHRGLEATRRRIRRKRKKERERKKKKKFKKEWRHLIRDLHSLRATAKTVPEPIRFVRCLHFAKSMENLKRHAVIKGYVINERMYVFFHNWCMEQINELRGEFNRPSKKQKVQLRL